MTTTVFDDVRVHPKGVRDDGIRGKLVLTAAGDSLSWEPTTVSSAAATEAQAYAFGVAMADVRSLRKAKPARGSGVAGGTLTVMLRSGVALPPLYFHRPNALQSFWAALEESHVKLIESPEDNSLFHVGEPAAGEEVDQLSKSVISFRLSVSASPPEVQTMRQSSDAVLPGPAPAATATTVAAAAAATGEAIPPKPQQNPPRPPPAQVPPTNQSTALADLQWLVLGGFGSVKKLAERAWTGQRASPPPTSPATTRFPIAANHPTEIGGFDFVGGTGPDARLLESESLQHLPVGSRERPLTDAQWVALLDDKGRMNQRNRVEFFRRAFYGGFSEGIREEAWKYLLGFYAFDSTYEERIEVFREKTEQYYAIKGQWTAITKDQEKFCSKFVTRREQIAKDIARTDRDYPFFEPAERIHKLGEILQTYVTFNADLGYAQGMNDLCAIVMNIMEGDEVFTFWCFRHLMERCGSCFRKDQVGMHTQLRALSRIVKVMDPQLYVYLDKIKSTEMFFCFRWMLVLFKREFSFDSTKRLWEAVFSDHLTPRFELFFAAAIILRTRNEILAREMQFDGILQFVNKLSGTLTVEPLLIEAECLFLSFLRCADPELKEFVLGGSASLSPP